MVYQPNSIIWKGLARKSFYNSIFVSIKKTKNVMKRILFIVVSAVLLLSSCENKQKEMLEGNWRMIWIQNGDMQVDARDLGSPVLSLEEKNDQYQMMTGTILEEGKWDSKKGTLILTPKAKEAITYSIDSMDKNTLIYHSEAGGSIVKVFYVRASTDGEEEDEK